MCWQRTRKTWPNALPRAALTAGLAWNIAPASTAPRCWPAAATFECFNRSQYKEGDHTIFVGEVERCEHREGASPCCTTAASSTPSTRCDGAAIVVRHVNVGTARRLKVGERSVLTAIGKTSVTGPVAVGPAGAGGDDEQADLSVHGGLAKAVYAYPAAHYAFWRAQRRRRGVSLFDDALPPGFMGENLTIDGPLEHEVFVGDEWHFPTACCAWRRRASPASSSTP